VIVIVYLAFLKRNAKTSLFMMYDWLISVWSLKLKIVPWSYVCCVTGHVYTCTQHEGNRYGNDLVLIKVTRLHQVQYRKYIQTVKLIILTCDYQYHSNNFYILDVCSSLILSHKLRCKTIEIHQNCGSQVGTL
jgi:hypothetical protein